MAEQLTGRSLNCKKDCFVLFRSSKLKLYSSEGERTHNMAWQRRCNVSCQEKRPWSQHQPTFEKADKTKQREREREKDQTKVVKVTVCFRTGYQDHAFFSTRGAGDWVRQLLVVVPWWVPEYFSMWNSLWTASTPYYCRATISSRATTSSK